MASLLLIPVDANLLILKGTPCILLYKNCINFPLTKLNILLENYKEVGILECQQSFVVKNVSVILPIDVEKTIKYDEELLFGVSYKL